MVAVIMLDALGRAVGQRQRSDDVGHVGHILIYVGVFPVEIARGDHGLAQLLHGCRVDGGGLWAGDR